MASNKVKKVELTVKQKVLKYLGTRKTPAEFEVIVERTKCNHNTVRNNLNMLKKSGQVAVVDGKGWILV